MDTIRRWWQAQCRAWEALHRAHAPWEQQGPLRWVRRYGAGWELHGATVPENARAGRFDVPS